MKIVVLVKQVPCAVGDLSFISDLTVDRGRLRAQLNEADEFAVDQALGIALRRRDVEITAVTMGPAGAVDALRRALLLGADQGVHVCDDALHGCDALATSRVLAAAVDRLGFDLVLCGSASADSGTAAVPAMVAERLGVAALCFADALTVGEHRVKIRRDDGSGLEVYAAALPAVVSVTERCGGPRYRPFVATVDARQKLISTWSLADLGVAVADVGLRAAATVVRAVTPLPNGKAHLLVEGDACSAAVRLADFLAERQFL
ncbi:MAG TPA: electron transfer flavoprotein subunit beta/FixA family protein [Jiangellales bacterium]|nr:electron transfer flavoprotein subunit beta/FixA family protein [Jiangellales bacterium]